jgi:hypothetical protein
LSILGFYMKALSILFYCVFCTFVIPLSLHTWSHSILFIKAKASWFHGLHTYMHACRIFLVVLVNITWVKVSSTLKSESNFIGGLWYLMLMDPQFGSKFDLVLPTFAYLKTGFFLITSNVLPWTIWPPISITCVNPKKLFKTVIFFLRLTWFQTKP